MAVSSCPSTASGAEVSPKNVASVMTNYVHAAVRNYEKAELSVKDLLTLFGDMVCDALQMLAQLGKLEWNGTYIKCYHKERAEEDDQSREAWRQY